MLQRPLGAVYLCLLGNRKIFMLDLQPQMVKHAHVDVGHPHQRKLCDEVATPALVEKLKPHQKDKNQRYVMAEAVLTGEQIEKFPQVCWSTGLTSLLAVFAWFTKHFLMGYCPGYAGYCETKQ
jgi:hypothetical protein